MEPKLIPLLGQYYFKCADGHPEIGHDGWVRLGPNEIEQDCPVCGLKSKLADLGNSYAALEKDCEWNRRNLG